MQIPSQWRHAVIKDEAMNVCEFRDDDVGVSEFARHQPRWLCAHIARSHSATEARVHLSGCWTISGKLL